MKVTRIGDGQVGETADPHHPPPQLRFARLLFDAGASALLSPANGKFAAVRYKSERGFVRTRLEKLMATRKSAAKSPAKTSPRKATKPEPRATTAEITREPAATKPRAAPRRKPQGAESAAAAPVQVSVAVPAGEERYRWIAHAAYLRAERRGFVPGKEVDDWLAAEAEFLAAFGQNAG